MSITIKKLAELSGVSRGTVDRVINNRGKVRPEIEATVRRLAKQYNYTPNLAGKALAVRKKTFTIGVIMASEGNQFFDDVFKGIREAHEELRDYSVKLIVRTMKGYGVEQQLELICELEGSINALILNAISDPKIAAKIDALDARGIGVVTLNTDIENSRRMCYVGSDYFAGGQTACGIMGLLTGGRATLGMVTGSVKILGHNQRITGFLDVMKRKYPEMRVVDYAETDDDEIRAFEVTKDLLAKNPEIDAVFIVAAGVYGACRAIISLGLQEKLTVISFDKIPTTIEMMKAGLIKATICQRPYMQGNKALHIAFDYLMSGIKPEIDKIIIDNQIRIFENL